ncbi:hypothetical protein QQX10_03505 [Demequina sp. SYSU T00039]|uniref:Thioredoxin family protein n=1 Tax=Demequina lignilytica TaxID=3051663 RepID=A0AAW7LZW2_9MICO|nr:MULTISPECIES: hypothetical protein [unclassified Demequina]MDN4477055.1 hypothetical protein [Demequina sp. SYSU T00039-1]MDN4487228.1 hypothetical protein [Demequina sp. SYSU T00039]MDN4491777.1 hypothetical protein [Demequina sp. SYSU T00068]
MRVELLHIADCPGHERAASRLRAALDSLGLAATRIEEVRVGAGSIPAGFAGSPTILVDGTDLFPGTPPLAHLACRVYRTGAGPANSPSSEQILAALASR